MGQPSPGALGGRTRNHGAAARISRDGRTVGFFSDATNLVGDDTNGKYALWEAIVPPSGGPPPHVHSREEEGFYILEGEITFTVNGE